VAEATIRAAILAALDTVSNIGVTEDYLRWAAEYNDLLALFKVSIGGVDQVRAWLVSLVSISDDWQDFSRSRLRTYRFRVDGYLGLDDSAATEKTFVALTEAVCEALADAYPLAADYSCSAATATIDHVLFGGIMCHHAAITIDATDQLA